MKAAYNRHTDTDYDEAVRMLNIMMLKFVPVDQYGDMEDTEPYEEAVSIAIDAIREVQKHEETFEWCTGCREYDQENHCCHRWNKCIRNTVAEIERDNQMRQGVTDKCSR